MGGPAIAVRLNRVQRNDAQAIIGFRVVWVRRSMVEMAVPASHLTAIARRVVN